MGRSSRRAPATKSHTLPSSPTHSSSSSDFEFTISASPRKSSAALCPADELFYKGQLLPLHLSPRLSMVRTLLLSSSSVSSSSDSATTASRDSTASSHSSSSSSSSSRPSSVAEEEFKRLSNAAATCGSVGFGVVGASDDSDIVSLVASFQTRSSSSSSSNNNSNKTGSSKYFSLAKFSSVFRKETNKNAAAVATAPSAVKRVGSSAKEVIRKYLKKVKPLYEKLSQKQQQQQQQQKSAIKVARSANTTLCMAKSADRDFVRATVDYSKDVISDSGSNNNVSLSFSGNLRYPTRSRRSCISSCPSSMMSSPKHGKSGFGFGQMSRAGPGAYNSDASSMEELQSAIQGAIAHCKNSMMMKNSNLVSNEI